MQGNSRSATAFDKLARLTNSMQHAERLSHDWLKVARAIRDLESDLKLNEPPESELFSTLAGWKMQAMSERRLADTAADLLSNQCIDLSAQLNNGVYDDEK